MLGSNPHLSCTFRVYQLPLVLPYGVDGHPLNKTMETHVRKWTFRPFHPSITCGTLTFLRNGPIRCTYPRHRHHRRHTRGQLSRRIAIRAYPRRFLSQMPTVIWILTPFLPISSLSVRLRLRHYHHNSIPSISIINYNLPSIRLNLPSRISTKLSTRLRLRSPYLRKVLLVLLRT